VGRIQLVGGDVDVECVGLVEMVERLRFACLRGGRQGVGTSPLDRLPGTGQLYLLDAFVGDQNATFLPDSSLAIVVSLVASAHPPGLTHSGGSGIPTL
jgi:hypothetical protein